MVYFWSERNGMSFLTIEFSWYMVWDSWYMVYFGGCGEEEKPFFCLSETEKRNETPPPSSESLWPTLPFSYLEIVWFYLPLEWGLRKIPLIWFIGESYFGYMVYLHPWYMVFPIIWFIFDGQNREPYMREPVYTESFGSPAETLNSHDRWSHTKLNIKDSHPWW